MASNAAARILMFPGDQPTGSGTDTSPVSFDSDTGTPLEPEPSRREDSPEIWGASIGDSPLRSVPLSDLGSEALRLAHPLYIVLSESDGMAIATSYDLELIEEGETDFEALDGLRAAIVELYETLSEFPQLPRHLQTKLDYLESLKLQ